MVKGELAQETVFLVIGSGPGGYAAAFRTAELFLGSAPLFYPKK
jgi:pyruvate/2-oxoglutarate dehydrogenase complex dihydrolipoamide dehydrogenase (E3) component